MTMEKEKNNKFSVLSDPGFRKDNRIVFDCNSLEKNGDLHDGVGTYLELRDLMIFKTGKHRPGGHEYTVQDIVSIVSNFDEYLARGNSVPLQVSHSYNAWDTVGHVKRVCAREVDGGAELVADVTVTAPEAIMKYKRKEFSTMSVGLLLLPDETPFLSELSFTPFPAVEGAGRSASMKDVPAKETEDLSSEDNAEQDNENHSETDGELHLEDASHKGKEDNETDTSDDIYEETSKINSDESYVEKTEKESNMGKDEKEVLTDVESTVDEHSDMEVTETTENEGEVTENSDNTQEAESVAENHTEDNEDRTEEFSARITELEKQNRDLMQRAKDLYHRERETRIDRVTEDALTNGIIAPTDREAFSAFVGDLVANDNVENYSDENNFSLLDKFSALIGKLNKKVPVGSEISVPTEKMSTDEYDEVTDEYTEELKRRKQEKKKALKLARKSGLIVEDDE